jgi:hypothetical protein
LDSNLLYLDRREELSKFVMPPRNFSLANADTEVRIAGQNEANSQWQTMGWFEEGRYGELEG